MLLFIVFTDHATLKYFFTKGNYKPHLFRWILLLQEFGLEIKDKKGVENAVTNHLSRSENLDITKKEKNIVEEFPYDHLFALTERPWFGDMSIYKVINITQE